MRKCVCIILTCAGVSSTACVRRAWCCMTASKVWWCGAEAGRGGAGAAGGALTGSGRSAASRRASAEPGSACSARRRSSTCHNRALVPSSADRTDQKHSPLISLNYMSTRTGEARHRCIKISLKSHCFENSTSNRRRPSHFKNRHISQITLSFQWHKFIYIPHHIN